MTNVTFLIHSSTRCLTRNIRPKFGVDAIGTKHKFLHDNLLSETNNNVEIAYMSLKYIKLNHDLLKTVKTEELQ